jgi:DNA-binding PadR family transcriptional regulator
MKKEKLKLLDDSGDRKYFTIVPNYILNHSTATDQALYLQMKRYAGEDGKCFVTQETLCKKLGIGRKALLKSLKYLLDHKWIEAIGLSGGKTRPIKTYKINDIWKENIEYYEKIPSQRQVSSGGDTVQKNSKIPSKRTVEEEPILRRTILTKVRDESAPFGNITINNLIKYFEEILQSSLDGTEQENRRYAYLLLKRFKKDFPSRDPEELIKGLITAGIGDSFHGKNLTNFKYLYYNAQKIIRSVKRDLSKNHITKIS